METIAKYFQKWERKLEPSPSNGQCLAYAVKNAFYNTSLSLQELLEKVKHISVFFNLFISDCVIYNCQINELILSLSL